MIFSSINVVPNHIFHKDPEKKFFMNAMPTHEQKLFEEAITNYGIANDGFERKYVTIFIFSRPPIDGGSLPQLALDKPTVYENDFYNNEIFNSNMLDVFDNINVDVAIADSNTSTYNLYAIPKKVQIVFKGLLEVTKYINAHTLARHVRICIHNEKMFVDMTDDTRGQIDNVLTMLKKFYSFRNQVFSGSESVKL